jgi:hypothetical protein
VDVSVFRVLVLDGKPEPVPPTRSRLGHVHKRAHLAARWHWRRPLTPTVAVAASVAVAGRVDVAVTARVGNGVEIVVAAAVLWAAASTSDTGRRSAMAPACSPARSLAMGL